MFYFHWRRNAASAHTFTPLRYCLRGSPKNIYRPSWLLTLQLHTGTVCVATTKQYFESDFMILAMTSTIGSANAQSFQRRTFTHVTCFVDWNSQLLRTEIDCEKEPIEAARAAFRIVTRQVAQCLVRVDANVSFQVHFRLYHGWRKGFQQTANLKAIRTVIAETDFSTASDKPRVVYSSNVEYGDCLLSALPLRMHQKLGIHLPNTFRDRGWKGHEEKMVDTALAADLVVRAYQEPNEWILLVTEDDDLIPPLYTAESIINRTQAKALLLSKRKRGSNMLLLDGLDAS